MPAEPAATTAPASIVAEMPASEFRRGWRHLLGAFIGMACGVHAVFMYSYGSLMPFLVREFGGGKAQWSLPVTLIALVSAFTAPLFGKLVDRFGPLRVFLPSLLAVAALMQATAWLVHSYAAMLAFAVTVAVVGSGAHNSSYLYALGRHFHRSRGLAIGIALSGTGLCGALFPQLAMRVAQAHGWRAAYSAIGVVLAAAAVVLALLMWDSGRGRRDADARAAAQGLPGLTGFTLKQARRMPAFLRAALIMVLFSLATTGQLPHLVSMAMAQGVEPERAAQMASLLGIAIIVGRLGAGYLLDRHFIAGVGSAFSLATAASLALMAIGQPSLLPLAIFGLGLGLGAEIDMIGYIVARYFGNRHYGAIFGLLFACYAVGSMLSPLTMGIFYDLTGSYLAGLIAAICLVLLTLPIMLTMPRYPSPDTFPGEDD